MVVVVAVVVVVVVLVNEVVRGGRGRSVGPLCWRLFSLFRVYFGCRVNDDSGVMHRLIVSEIMVMSVMLFIVLFVYNGYNTYCLFTTGFVCSLFVVMFVGMACVESGFGSKVHLNVY